MAKSVSTICSSSVSMAKWPCLRAVVFVAQFAATSSRRCARCWCGAIVARFRRFAVFWSRQRVWQDPAPFIQLLLNNPLVSHFLRLDTVVTTVDAANAVHQFDRQYEAVKQVALADRLLITKCDLVSNIDALEQRLRRLNPGARIERVMHGEIDPAGLFGAGLVDPEKKAVDVGRWLNEQPFAGSHELALEHRGHAHHGHDHHSHDTSITSFMLAFDEPLDWMAVSHWLAYLRSTRGEDLLRVKGILNLRGAQTPVVIHGVHHVFHPPVALPEWPDADRRSRIVFITRGIAREEVLALWQAGRAAA